MADGAKQRLIIERRELRRKGNALENFIVSDRFKLLKPKNRRLLKKQFRIMKRYFIILNKRLELFEE